MRHILKCECGNYVLESCECGGEVLMPRPPKYSPEDKYASYRRKAKEEQRKKEGII